MFLKKTAVAVAAAFMAFSGPACAEVVLLRNGSLLEGEVLRTAEGLVVLDRGAEIRLPRREVAHVAESALAVYEWRRQQGGEGLVDHLQLAEWALQNQLWPQAARELLDARQLAPRSARLALLERRLDELTRPAAPRRPVDRERVSEPADPNPEPLPKLPDGALEHFTRGIQPLLMNGCTLGGCHRGAEGDAFPLDPSWRHGYGNARSTDHNLRTTLAAIDFESPGTSALLTATRGPHAGVTPFAGPRRAELLERLEQWAAWVASANAPPPPPAAAGAVQQAVYEAPAAKHATQAVTPAVEPAAYEAAAAEPDVEAVRAPAVRRGLGAARSTFRDEFDPEIFNQRHRRPQDDEPLP